MPNTKSTKLTVWSEKIPRKSTSWPTVYEIYFHYSLYEIDERLRNKTASLTGVDAPQEWATAVQIARDFVGGFPGRRSTIYQNKPMIRFGMDAPNPRQSLAPGDTIDKEGD